MATKFITDSMNDLGKDLSKEYDFDVLPIPITVGEKTYMDKIDVTPEMIMEFGKHGPDFPKTSSISTGVYQEAFEKHLKNGDDVLYLGLSSGLSGTMQAAHIAAEELREKYPERTIALVDSQVATLAMSMLLQQGLKLDRLNKPIGEIEETLNFLADHLNVFFVVADLKWMAKGGRLSKGAATLGNLLNVVPILYLNRGQIEVFDKVRGKKKATKRLEQILKAALEENPDQIVGLFESKNKEAVDKFKKIIAKFPHASYVEAEKGPGSGLTVHIGDDIYGLGFFDELPDNYVNVNP